MDQKTPAFFARIRQLVADDRLDDALRLLRPLLENSPLLDEAIVQSASFQDIRKLIRLGTVSHAEANLTKNQIRAGLLDLLQEIEENTGNASTRPDAPALREEVGKAVSIVESKNVLIGSPITAGRDVHIGDKHVGQNIVIQNVTDSTLTLNVGGEVQEIRNELAALRFLLQNQRVQNVQYAEKIYPIEHIDEANFGFITGKKAFNESLTKKLIEAIRPHSPAARRFLDSLQVRNTPAWESRLNYSDKAKEIIAYSFVGVIGIQLSKLMAIGKEDFSELKQRKYIGKCLDIAGWSLDLLSFVLVSTLWDEQKQRQIQFDETERDAFEAFFDNTIERSLSERFHLLQVLSRIFSKKEMALSLPLDEWEEFAPALQSDSEFHRACLRLEEINERLDKDQCNLLDCFEAENHLAALLQPLSFLAGYRMASIKQIGYRRPRNAEPRYLHRYAALGIDSKANLNAEKINYTPETAQTDAVLLYRGDDYGQNVSLFPFVIDFNALTFEQGAKICFYRSQALDGGALEYTFLEDNSAVCLEMQHILKPDTDLNELMMQTEKRKILNIDNVVGQFREARRCLLGDE